MLEQPLEYILHHGIHCEYILLAIEHIFGSSRAHICSLFAQHRVEAKYTKRVRCVQLQKENNVRPSHMYKPRTEMTW